MRPGLTRAIAPVVVAFALFAGSSAVVAPAAVGISFAIPTVAFAAAASTASDECGGLIFALTGRCGVWETSAQ
jgi:hypothetical protein